MKDTWKIHAYAATTDLAAAHLAKTEADVLVNLRDALENIGRAIDAIENGGDKEKP